MPAISGAFSSHWYDRSDFFAAGFVGGLAWGADHIKSAKLGALAAAEVIRHIGARP